MDSLNIWEQKEVFLSTTLKLVKTVFVFDSGLSPQVNWS